MTASELAQWQLACIGEYIIIIIIINMEWLQSHVVNVHLDYVVHCLQSDSWVVSITAVQICQTWTFASQQPFTGDCLWRGRSKRDCQIVGSVTIACLTTEAVSQSSLLCAVMSTGVMSGHRDARLRAMQVGGQPLKTWGTRCQLTANVGSSYRRSTWLCWRHNEPHTAHWKLWQHAVIFQ